MLKIHILVYTTNLSNEATSNDVMPIRAYLEDHFAKNYQNEYIIQNDYQILGFQHTQGG